MATIVVTEPVTAGRIVFKTSVGDIAVEMWSRETPRTCRNIVQLSLEGFFDGCPFHRIVPGFIAQTGDPSGTGSGGESIYDEGMFEDEFNQRIKFNRRGLVAMANQGKRNTNLSQFFFTLGATPELQDRNTIWGRVAGDTLFNVLALGELELVPGTDRPTFPPTIKSVVVEDNPFDDIVPRITAKERKEQERAKKEAKMERAKQREQGKRKGTKNKALLSFGEEAEEVEADDAPKTKFKSAHDALQDGRLSNKVIDDRGVSATLPEEFMPAPAKKRKTEPAKTNGHEDAAAKLAAAKEARAVASGSGTSNAVQDEIKKLQADLKKMSKRSPSPDAANEKGKKKRTGASLLQLEREKYTRGAKASKGKGKKSAQADDDDDVLASLNSFRAKIAAAKDDDENDEAEGEEGYAGEVIDELDGDDSGWLGHKLKFRKDATLDRHTIDEYEVVDPLAKSNMTLAEIREKKDARRREYAGESGSSSRGDDRDRERDRDRRPRERSPDRRGDIRSDWRSQRVQRD